MSEKFEGSHTAPKAYRTLLNRLIYSKNVPAIPPLLVDGNFFQTFVPRQTLLISTFDQNVHPEKTQVFYDLFHTK